MVSSSIKNFLILRLSFCSYLVLPHFGLLLLLGELIGLLLTVLLGLLTVHLGEPDSERG